MSVEVGEGARLRAKIELALPELLAASRRLGDPPAHPASCYPEYLFATHCVVRASVPLMEAARRRALELDADPVSAALAEYLAEHEDEERDHDEWLLDDLEVLGRERAAILARPPSPTVAAAVGAQYYWILHYHPVALLGYIAVLEGYPPSPELVDDLIARTGHPPEAFRTLRAHAELDPGHRQELDELLDRLPLTREQSEAVGLSALASARAMARAFDEIV